MDRHASGALPAMQPCFLSVLGMQDRLAALKPAAAFDREIALPSGRTCSHCACNLSAKSSSPISSMYTVIVMFVFSPTKPSSVYGARTCMYIFPTLNITEPASQKEHPAALFSCPHPNSETLSAGSAVDRQRVYSLPSKQANSISLFFCVFRNISPSTPLQP